MCEVCGDPMHKGDPWETIEIQTEDNGVTHEAQE
jgi:hypothetical protein